MLRGSVESETYDYNVHPISLVEIFSLKQTYDILRKIKRFVEHLAQITSRKAISVL